jgi:hypothetical protein
MRTFKGTLSIIALGAAALCAAPAFAQSNSGSGSNSGTVQITGSYVNGAGTTFSFSKKAEPVTLGDALYDATGSWSLSVIGSPTVSANVKLLGVYDFETNGGASAYSLGRMISQAGADWWLVQVDSYGDGAGSDNLAHVNVSQWAAANQRFNEDDESYQVTNWDCVSPGTTVTVNEGEAIGQFTGSQTQLLNILKGWIAIPMTEEGMNTSQNISFQNPSKAGKLDLSQEGLAANECRPIVVKKPVSENPENPESVCAPSLEEFLLANGPGANEYHVIPRSYTITGTNKNGKTGLVQYNFETPKEQVTYYCSPTWKMEYADLHWSQYVKFSLTGKSNANVTSNWCYAQDPAKTVADLVALYDEKYTSKAIPVCTK